MGFHNTIGNFGDVAAEQDVSVLSYFLKTDAVNRIADGSTVVVLGRKGSGKIALAKYFSEPGQDYLSDSLSLRDYPWSVHLKRRNLGASEIESYVSSWRYLMAVRAIVLLIRSSSHKQIFDTQRAAIQFLQDNYGGVTPSLQDVLRPKRLKLKGAFRPTVMGNSVGEVSFDTDDGAVQPEIDALTDAILDCAKTLMSQTGVQKILLHFDELDQGLSAIDQSHEKMIIGLILAARLFRSSQKKNEPGIYPVAYLRTDIWDEFRFSDKNKISQSSAVLLEWNSETLQAMVNQRIRVKLGDKYSWDDLDDGSLMRGSQSKWNRIISRTFLRPRDVIQFLNCALSISLSRTQTANLFDNEDIQQARESYSRYLKQELDDELGPHWDKWSEALQACSEIATITLSRDAFLESYSRRKTKKNNVMVRTL